MRRQFDLTERDRVFLEARSLVWETIIENNQRWLIIHAYRIVGGYDHSYAMAAINISSGYPDTQLDMVYFYPHLALSNGRFIGALTSHHLDGKIWQRWSRHRTQQNPWRAGLDDLSTHFALVDYWLEREV